MTKEKIIPLARKAVHILFTLFLLTVPCISYFLFEYVTGNLATIPSYMAALNIGWIYTLYLLVFAATGRTRIAVPAVSILLFILSPGRGFRGILPKPSHHVLGYSGLWNSHDRLPKLRIHHNKVHENRRTDSTRHQCRRSRISKAYLRPQIQTRLCGHGGRCHRSLRRVVFHFSCPRGVWESTCGRSTKPTKEYGYILSTAVSFRYAVKRSLLDTALPRSNGFIMNTNRKMSSWPPPRGFPGRGYHPPVNIICIMNESLSDLRTGGSFDTNQEYFPFLYSLKEHTISGSLCIPVFGSMTCNSNSNF